MTFPIDLVVAIPQQDISQQRAQEGRLRADSTLLDTQCYCGALFQFSSYSFHYCFIVMLEKFKTPSTRNKQTICTAGRWTSRCPISTNLKTFHTWHGKKIRTRTRNTKRNLSRKYYNVSQKKKTFFLSFFLMRRYLMGRYYVKKNGFRGMPISA